MSEPLAICIERLDAEDQDERYVQCVAVPGLESGLGVTAAGEVVWQVGDLDGCELCVAADGRLLLWRPAGAAGVVVRRAGRSLDAPAEKPIFLLDQDRIEIGGRRFRVHVHGPAPAVHPPSPLRMKASGRVAALAAAVVLGGAAAGCDMLGKKTEDIEIREAPPAAPPPPPPPDDAGDA
ncbi:MAG: hypothetical protein JRI23_34785, partial [Deltaproteobacteria bacterium]|nr:hypothetical protein [Deltaproteobacteria bacterium]MBW2537474.1 hypothetical protein [Deltaproteobacteria bacterium]